MGTEADGKRGTEVSAATYLSAEFHGVLANPVRHDIVMRCGERPWSATELAEALELPRRQITDQIEVLKRVDPPFLECVGKKASPKGGSMYMYRATRYVLHADQWKALSSLEQEVSSANIVSYLTEELHQALRDATLYSHPHHVLYRDRHMVDDQGMINICRILTRASEEVDAEVDEAMERMTESEEQPIPITLGLLSFEVAPKGARSVDRK